MENINLLKMKFFKKPCFTCKNLQWDSDGCEYSSYSWAYCDNLSDEVMERANINNIFPNIEAPNKCIRKNTYIFNKHFNKEIECDYWGLLYENESALNVEFEDNYNHLNRVLARQLAHSVSEFNFKMRTLGRLEK